jgi:hypothetical protein
MNVSWTGIRKAPLIAVAALALASCGAVHASVEAQRGAPCHIAGSRFPAAADLPGFTQYVSYTKLAYHMAPTLGKNVPQSERAYVCGKAAGFLANMSLTGRYREENSSQARALGYTIGKWPYTPLNGSIVSQQRHKALEIYVSIFQFTSATAARNYIDPAHAMPAAAAGLAHELQPRVLHVLRIPGVTTTQEPVGANPATSETDITVKVPLGNFAAIVAVAGGESFSWPDALPYWKKAYALLAPLEGNR